MHGKRCSLNWFYLTFWFIWASDFTQYRKNAWLTLLWNTVNMNERQVRYFIKYECIEFQTSRWLLPMKILSSIFTYKYEEKKIVYRITQWCLLILYFTPSSRIWKYLHTQRIKCFFFTHFNRHSESISRHECAILNQSQCRHLVRRTKCEKSFTHFTQYKISATTLLSYQTHICTHARTPWKKYAKQNKI